MYTLGRYVCMVYCVWIMIVLTFLVNNTDTSWIIFRYLKFNLGLLLLCIKMT